MMLPASKCHIKVPQESIIIPVLSVCNYLGDAVMYPFFNGPICIASA